MAQYSPVQINYNPVSTYPGTQQNNFVGPQSSPSSFADGTMALYLVQNSPDDQTGTQAANNDLTTVGTLAYIQNPTPAMGPYCTGPFSDTNYFTTPSSLNTAFEDLGAYTIEMWVYPTSLTNSSGYDAVVWSTQSGSFYMQITGTGAVAVVTTTSLTTANSLVAINQWTNIAFVWDGLHRWIYVTPLGGTTTVTSDTNSGLISSITSMYIGRYETASFSFTNGYLNGVRFSNAARTAFPTSDGTPRGYLPPFRNTNSIFLSQTGSDSTGTGTSTSPRRTLGGIFATTPSLLQDNSGNAYSLTQASTSAPVPTLLRDAYPQPAASNYGAGPFTTASYLVATTLATHITSTFSLECFVWLNSLSAVSTIFQFWSGTNTNVYTAYVNTTGTITFTTGTNSITTGTIFTAGETLNQWYHLAFTWGSGTATVYVNGVNVKQAAASYTFVTPTGGRVGVNVSTTDPFTGYLDRMVVLGVVGTAFPTLAGAANILGFYDFETEPFIQTCTYSSATKYLVLSDSSLYNETNVLLNGAYNLAEATNPAATDMGIYALDGQTPTIQVEKGAIPGTYGARISGRSIFYTGSNYLYVSKSGNDSTGALNNPALPFLTIHGALASGTTNYCIQIQDNGIYQEDLNLTYSLTIQAASGFTPVLKNVNTSAAGRHVTSSGAFTTVFNGLTFDESNGLGAVFEAILFIANDCTIRNAYAMFLDNTYNAIFNGCEIVSCPITGSGGYLGAVNCYFASQTGAATQISINGSNSMVNCTFSNQPFILSLGYGEITYTIDRCEFINSPFTYFVEIPVAGNSVYLSLLNTTFSGCGIVVSAGDVSGAILYIAISNCLVENFTGSAFSFSATTLGTIHFSCKHCIALGCTTGFNINQGSGTLVSGWLDHCAAINATAPIDVVSSTTIYGNGFVQNSGSIIGSPTLYYSLTNNTADFIGTDENSYNTALSPASPGIFGGNINNNKCVGPQAAIIESNLPNWTLNGINLVGDANMEGGFTYSDLATYFVNAVNTGAPAALSTTMAYCGVSGCGPFGMQMQYGTAMNSIFETNGFGIQNFYGTLSRCLFDGCGSAAINQFSQSPLIQNCSSYGALYGFYANFGAAGVVANCVFSGSGAYDFSGDGQCTYCCIGTLDPGRSGSVDSNSTNLDPLFRNIMAGDFRLQTVENGYYFNSPAKLAGSDGNDMGAFNYSYGVLNQVWATLTLVNNPDQVDRNQIVIKAAEGDTEGGNLYSTGRSFQTLYKFIWNENNPMPASDLTSLISVFNTGNGQCQLSFDGGNTWIPVRVVRSSGFEWNDLDMMYNDNNKPTPVREIDFRISA